MSSKTCKSGKYALALSGFVTVFLSLSGCSSLSEKECLSADWRTIGYEDAVSGRKLTRLGDHRSACAKYHVAPQLDEYQRGYTEGLQAYCRPDTVFQLGRNGNAYPTQCPDEMADELKTSYGYGRNIHELDSEIKGLHKRLHGKELELKKAETDLADLKSKFIGQDVPAARRAQLLERTINQINRITTIKGEIEQLEDDLVVRQNQLDRLVSVLQLPI